MSNLFEDKVNELILEMLEENQSMNLGNIVRNLGISAENGLNHLLRLKELGVVKNVQNAEFAISTK